MPEAYLESSRTSTINMYEWVLNTPLHLFSPIESMSILNIFAVKYTFSDKRRINKVVVSELKEIS